MTMYHIMLNLETWGTKPYSVIVQIGATHFDIHDLGVFRDSFEVSVDPESAVAAGLRMDPVTVMWWMQPEQSDARNSWLERLKVDLSTALDGFEEWLNSFSGIDKRMIWGNGVDFDAVLLCQAYEICKREAPWHWWNTRCFRTMKALDPQKKLEPVRPTALTAHMALGDAILQAKWLQAIVAKHNLVF